MAYSPKTSKTTMMTCSSYPIERPRATPCDLAALIHSLEAALSYKSINALVLYGCLPDSELMAKYSSLLPFDDDDDVDLYDLLMSA